jgi:hypothetical protein
MRRIAFLSVFISLSSFAQDPSLFSLNKDKSKINNTEFPRTDLTLYRGLRYGFTLKEALRSFYGDEKSNLESKSITNGKHTIQGTTSPVWKGKYYSGITEQEKKDLDKIKEERDKKVAMKLKKKKSEKNAIKYKTNDPEAVSNLYFNNKLNSLSDKEKKEKYIDYSSPKYEDWSGDLIFGSVYHPVADQFGDIVVGYKDFSKRGVDLNYYNSYASYAADRGEYVLPLEIKSSDVISFTKKSIKETFVKVTYDGEIYIIVYGGDVSCVDREETTQLIYKCDQSYPDSWNSPIPKFTKKPTPIAILKACDSNKCKLPQGLKNKYGLTNKTPVFSEETIKEIADYDLNGKKLVSLTNKNKIHVKALSVNSLKRGFVKMGETLESAPKLILPSVSKE